MQDDDWKHPWNPRDFSPSVQTIVFCVHFFSIFALFYCFSAAEHCETLSYFLAVSEESVIWIANRLSDWVSLARPALDPRYWITHQTAVMIHCVYLIMPAWFISNCDKRYVCIVCLWLLTCCWYGLVFWFWDQSLLIIYLRLIESHGYMLNVCI